MGERMVDFKNCFVAFIDVLGVRNLLKKLKQNSKKINNITDALKINSYFIDSDTKQTSEHGKLKIKGFYFSDSFAFVMEKEPKNLPHLFLIIRYLQDKFWEQGFCFRGGITIGEMYFPESDDNVLIGEGLMKAYELESKIAIYPRIVVDKELYKFIETKKIKGYPFTSKGYNLSDGIKKDKDGVYFLDLLSKKILRKEGENIEKGNNNSFYIGWSREEKSSFKNILNIVKKLVKNNLETKDVKIKQKYEWLNSYLQETEGD